MPQWLNPELVRVLRSVFMPLPANLGARVYGSAQNVGDSAYENIEFDTERWDTGSTGAGGSYPNGMWDVATPARLFAVHRGWHTISGHLAFATDAVGIRGIQIVHGAATVIARSEIDALAGQPTPMSISTKYWMNAGEFVKLQAYQDTGGALQVLEEGNYSPEFVMVRIP